jgi:hypothetical protein
MGVLIAMISSGKGTWGKVNSLIKIGEWDKIYLICNDFSDKNFKIDVPNLMKLIINEKRPQKSINILSKFLRKEIKDELDVALNLDSGNGMEHMILISAILKSGLGLRMVYPDNNEVKELKIMESFIVEEEY